MSTPILPFAVWQSGTNQNSVPANDNSLRNQILNGLVISDSTDAQPVSPIDGDIYIMTGAASGDAWVTFDEFDLAIFMGGTWYAFAPIDGIVVNLAGSLIAWDGSAYVSVGGGSGGGASIGVQYVSDLDSTADSDPGAGLLKWNNATQTSATFLYLDDQTSDGSDLTGFWSALSAGGFAYLQDTALQDTWQIWEITAITDAAGYVKLAVSLLASGDAFLDSASMLVTLQQGASGVGLTNFTEGVNTAAPNGTIPVVSLEATNAATNVDIAFVPKGNGAFTTDIADNTTAGGNKRGIQAVDLQFGPRSNAAQVASGSLSTIGGGNQNTASAQGSCVPGTRANTASGVDSFAVSVGVASATEAVALGGTASGLKSLATTGGIASGTWSSAIGNGADVRGGQSVFSEGAGVTNYSRMRYTLRNSTTTDTPVVLSTNAAAAAATNQVYLGTSNNTSLICSGLIVARQTGNGGGAKSWKFEAHLDRDHGAGTPVHLVAAVVPVVIADSGEPWDVAITADNTLRTLTVTATGEAAITIRWACYIEAQEIPGA